MSVVWKPSHCPRCKHAIRAYDNVPVLGWLWLRGKCRDCSEPISPRYAIVELVMGVAFFVLAYAEIFSGGANLPGGPITEFTGAIDTVLVPYWPLLGTYAYHTLLLSLLMSIALIDLDGQKVPRSLFWFGAGLGLIATGLGVRYGIGLDGSHSRDWGTGDWGKHAYGPSIQLGQALAGAVCGFVVGTLVAGISTAGTRNKQPAWARAVKIDPTITAYTLTGLFLDYSVLFYAIVVFLLMFFIGKTILTKTIFAKKRLATPTVSLWVAVVVFLSR